MEAKGYSGYGGLAGRGRFDEFADTASGAPRFEPFFPSFFLKNWVRGPFCAIGFLFCGALPLLWWRLPLALALAWGRLCGPDPT